MIGDKMGGVGTIMTAKIRSLMLKILEGNAMVAPYSAIPPHLFRIYKHPHAEEIFSGLVEREITGVKFLRWFTLIHGENLRTAANDILSRRSFKRTKEGLILIS